MTKVVWHGTQRECLELLYAVQRHCKCRVQNDRRRGACAAHAMLAHDQRAVDGLLFMRRLAQRLLAEEFDGSGPVGPTPPGGLDRLRTS